MYIIEALIVRMNVFATTYLTIYQLFIKVIFIKRYSKTCGSFSLIIIVKHGDGDSGVS